MVSTRTWLLPTGDPTQVRELGEAQSGEPRQLVEGKASGGMISPDNRWLAVIVGEEKQSKLSLYSVAGGEGKELGEGFFPIWLSP